MGECAIVRRGKPLPTLTSPASASDIRSGRQAINKQGQIITGNVDFSVLNALGCTDQTISATFRKGSSSSSSASYSATLSLSVSSRALMVMVSSISPSDSRLGSFSYPEVQLSSGSATIYLYGQMYGDSFPSTVSASVRVGTVYGKQSPFNGTINSIQGTIRF